MEINREHIRVIVVTFILITVFSHGITAAEETEGSEKPEWIPEISAEVTLETKYIWRGQRLVDDPVIQPAASVRLPGLTFSVWGNYDAGTLDKFTEWDYIFDYTTSIGEIRKRLTMDEEGLEFINSLGISIGYTFYTFPHLSGDDYTSHEFYVGLSYDVLLEPFFTYYYDFDSGNGSYFEFGAGHTFELPGGVALDLGLTTGYNLDQWGYDSSFSNMLFSGSVDVPLFKYFAVSPDVNYSLALDSQYDCEFYGGVKIIFNF